MWTKLKKLRTQADSCRDLTIIMLLLVIMAYPRSNDIILSPTTTVALLDIYVHILPYEKIRYKLCLGARASALLSLVLWSFAIHILERTLLSNFKHSKLTRIINR
jgi:hypothetical protein